MLRICVFQNWGLGDLVMTVPVIAELRRLHPDAEITLVVRGRAQEVLLASSQLVDRIVGMPAKRHPLATLRALVGLRRFHFDMAFIATRIMSPVALLLRVVVGVRTVLGDAPRHRWLYAHAGTIDPGQHRVDRMLDTLELWTGSPAAPAEIPLPISPVAEAEAAELLGSHGLVRGRYLAIHPGSSLAAGLEKRIPLETVASVAGQLRAEYPELSVAILLGPEDMDLQPALSQLGEGIVAISGTSLDVTKVLLAHATAFMGSDSALGHLAAAFDVPTLTLAGPTIPTETRPYGPHAKVLTRDERLECQPCWGTSLYGRCPHDARCMRDISAALVYEEIEQMISQPRTERDAAAAAAR